MRKLVLIGALTLAGCGGTTHLEFPKPPADRLVCPDEPGTPTTRGPDGRVTDEAAGRYMGALRNSWQGCRDDVDFMRDWFAALDRAAKNAKVK